MEKDVRTPTRYTVPGVVAGSAAVIGLTAAHQYSSSHGLAEKALNKEDALKYARRVGRGRLMAAGAAVLGGAAIAMERKAMLALRNKTQMEAEEE